MMPLDLPHGSKILLRLPNWLGDVVLCTPSLRALRRARPDLRCHALVKPAVRRAVEGLEGLEEVLELPGTSLAETLRTARRLREMHFRAALVFPKGFREALLVRLARIPARIGLATDRRSLLLTHPVPFTAGDWNEHHSVQFAKVLAPLGAELEDDPPAFPLSSGDRAEASGIIEARGLNGKAFAVFHITASQPPRAWHTERSAVLGRRLSKEHGLSVVLVGAPGDQSVHRAFLEECPDSVDLAGETSFGAMAAVIERAALFVGSDSGPMHVAAAVGAPVAAVFGPGAPRKTAPRVPAERIRVLYSSEPCSPCRQSFFKDCAPCPSGKPPCIEAVTVEQVYDACLELLKSASEEPS